VQTDFGPNVKLHDYSGANHNDRDTNGDGWFEVWVPPMGYVVWGPAGISGGFDPPPRRTVQEFQLDDDLGDSSANSPRWGGKIQPGEFRKAGMIWAAAESLVKVWVYTDGEQNVELLVHNPDENGAGSQSDGSHTKAGPASNGSALYLEFNAEREGYHQLSAKLTDPSQAPTRAYVKVEYSAPPSSTKF
jgi:alpha-amylase